MADNDNPLTQDTRIAEVNTPLGKDILALRKMTVTEELGRLPTFDLDLTSERGVIKPDDLIGKPVTVSLHIKNDRTRYFNGYVVKFGRLAARDRLYSYRAIVAPWIWFLTRTRNCRIFQNLSVRDIIEKVFKEHGFPYKPRLSANYTIWEYCVQYRESDFDFVSRLMEQEGIYYYYEYEENQNTLILADSPSAHDPVPGYEEIRLRPPGSHASQEVREHIRQFIPHIKHLPGTYTHTDFNFETPAADLRASSSSPGDYPLGNLEIYDYPGEYEKHGEGEDWARSRMEEITARTEVVDGWGDTRGMAAGSTFELIGCDDPALNQKYLTTSATHTLNTGEYESGRAGADDGPVYEVKFTVQPITRIFRTERETAKPRIRGLQTATVTGPGGEEIYTDKYGRIKVQFHWDREGKYDENTTCFLRVAQAWAGNRWGATFTPRIGQEVVVAFLEGDPDSPLVIGSVYNGQQMAPYLGHGPDPRHPDDKNISGIKSCSTKGGRGYNEWRFDDTKGEEQIFFHAERDLDTRVKNDTRTDVGGSVHLTVGYQDAHGRECGSVQEKILRTKTTHTGDSIVDYADNGRRTYVGTNGQYREGIDAGGNFTAAADGTFSIKAGSVLIEASAQGQISLKCGASFVVIKPDGIYINGPMVYVNSGGASAAAKDLARPSIPTDPDRGDDAETGSVSAPSAQNPVNPPNDRLPASDVSSIAPPPKFTGDDRIAPPEEGGSNDNTDDNVAPPEETNLDNTSRDPATGNGPYGSADDAARAALNNANPQSIQDNKEYAGLIYQDQDGKYYYTDPEGGNGDTSQPYDSPAPAGATVVGSYHTHGDYSTMDANGNPVRTDDPGKDQFNSDDFSREDKAFFQAHSAPGQNHTGYVGTPSGKFRRYDPGSGSNTTF